MAISITQGVNSFCNENEVFWFVDVILSYQSARFKAQNEFQVWKFIKNKTGNGCKAVCEDGNSNVLISQRISFTDCMLKEFTIWFSNDVVYLPSEH